jgi:Asp-tRNA(Asn)/Glu-tRNA(Gln) amidotransferase A subunit family amidase
VETLADEDGLKAFFDKYELDALVCTLADVTGAPIILASPARYATHLIFHLDVEMEVADRSPLSVLRYPIITVPLGYDESIQEPVGMYIVGRPWSEGLLLEIM